MQNIAAEGGRREMDGRKGIMVSNEFHVHDDVVSDEGDLAHKPAATGNWTNLGDNAARQMR